MTERFQQDICATNSLKQENLVYLIVLLCSKQTRLFYSGIKASPTAGGL